MKAGKRVGVERLENRLLFAAAPKVTSIIADNRGEIFFTVDQPLNASTVNSTSVQMHTTGPDGKFGTLDDVKIAGKVRYFPGNGRITFRTSALPVNTTYSMKISGKRVLGADGQKLDGEFNGTSGVPSGNGVGGGDMLLIAKKQTTLTARFSTELNGAFNVSLFTSQTPKNVANFIKYVNTAAYDGSFLHRSIPGFIVQGGGFNVQKGNTIGSTADYGPVDNESKITSSTRGTIALARPDDQNPATDDKGSNQWFFNLADNSSNLDNQNGGFTAFGQVTNAAGLAVMDSLAAYPTINGGGVFANLPVQNSSIDVNAAAANPAGTLILIRRVAILNKVLPFA